MSRLPWVYRLCDRTLACRALAPPSGRATRSTSATSPCHDVVQTPIESRWVDMGASALAPHMTSKINQPTSELTVRLKTAILTVVRHRVVRKSSKRVVQP
eukprot:5054781-Prymnesium_polylepis.2